MQQKAWLSATPSSKRKSSPRKPRYEEIVGKGGTPLMPPSGDLSYLLDYWTEAGYLMGGGMAPAPLTAGELIAWQNGTQTPLMPWEFQIILDMSREFVAFMRTAEDAACPAPYGATQTEARRKALSQNLGLALNALAGKGKNK